MYNMRKEVGTHCCNVHVYALRSVDVYTQFYVFEPFHTPWNSDVWTFVRSILSVLNVSSVLSVLSVLKLRATVTIPLHQRATIPAAKRQEIKRNRAAARFLH